MFIIFHETTDNVVEFYGVFGTTIPVASPSQLFKESMLFQTFHAEVSGMFFSETDETFTDLFL